MRILNQKNVWIYAEEICVYIVFKESVLKENEKFETEISRNVGIAFQK